ncbi:MAG: hypothetical protein V4659_00655 [Pseudomonadota bacterium]
MRWIDPTAVRRALMFAGLASIATAAAADTLVVRAIGPSAAAYPPGKKLPDTAKLRLQARDVITLLDARGTRTLKGPGIFSASASTSADNGTTVLAALTSERRDRRVRIGAVRQVEGVTDARPDIWMVDVAKPGAVCVTDPAAVTLWRSDPSKAAQGSIAEVGGKASAQLSWAPGQASQPWPAGLKVATGARYRVATGAAAPIELRTFVVVPAPADLPDIASALIKNGCATQLDQVVATAAAVSAAGS